MKKKITITFKNRADFRNRIAKLWQEQKENEEYEFIFLDRESEDDFEKLSNAFS